MNKCNPFFYLLLVISLSACEKQKEGYQPQYEKAQSASEKTVLILGVHPLHNPQKLYKTFYPLADYLSKKLSSTKAFGTIKVEIEASKDYPSYDKKLQNEVFDLTLPNPFQTINSFNYSYKVINQMGATDLFRGIILIRKDSAIEKISDLRGKEIAYPAPTALAATMMPQYYLQTHGLDLAKDTVTLYVGSQESSIMNVYYKYTAASATWPVPWIDLQRNKPDIAKHLKVAWQTETLPNNSFSYHKKKVSSELAEKIQTVLSELHTHPEGQKVLYAMSIKQVYTASDETYQPVVNFVKKFKQLIGNNALLDRR